MKKIYLWLPFIAWYTAILYLSSIPSLRISSDVQSDEIMRIPAHFFEYGVLAFLFFPAFVKTFKNLKNKIVISIFAILILSILDELWQSTVPTRTLQLKDLMWDNAGSVIAIITADKIYQKLK